MISLKKVVYYNNLLRCMKRCDDVDKNALKCCFSCKHATYMTI